jgi:hypothetical protein
VLMITDSSSVPSQPARTLHSSSAKVE